MDEGQFRAICQNALEGLASKKLNLAMLVERRALAQERRVVPETIARFLREAAPYATLDLKPVASLPHAFDPGRTPTVLRKYEREPDWRLPALAARYPRCSTERETAEKHTLEWVTPGHPLFEAVRRHTAGLATEPFTRGPSITPSRMSSRPEWTSSARGSWMGLANTIHERLFAVELTDHAAPVLREPGILGNFTPATPPASLPAVALAPEPLEWLHQEALGPFLEETRKERLAEVERIAAHVELSLTELLQRADEEIGRAALDVDRKIQGAEGRLSVAESRHAELLARRDRRRQELERQRGLSLQAVERITSVLVLPHPERETPEVRRLQSNPETEATAMQTVMDYERVAGPPGLRCPREEPRLRSHQPRPELRASCASSRSRGWAQTQGRSSSRPTSAAWPKTVGTATGSMS